MTTGLKFMGRPPIRFAESVKDVVRLDNPYARQIMDRSVPMTAEFVEAILAQSIFGWEGRVPTPALRPDGTFVGTDLDLLSFLVPIEARGAVIEVPNYRNRRAQTIRPNERRIGSGSRFGKVNGLISNQNAFSFSIRIWDNTVAVTDPETGTETIGRFTNMMLVDVDGNWHDGWDRIVWLPTAAENAFLNDCGLWTGNTVYFRNAIHPNRWSAIFGAPYLLLKMLSDRLADEAKFYREEVKRLVEAGARFPTVGTDRDYVPPIVGDTRAMKVATLEVALDTPGYTGNYPSMPNTSEGLVRAADHQRELTYTLRPQVQFVVRADELAYFKYGQDRVAHWMVSRTWRDYKVPGGRTVWQQMVLSNEASIRMRTKEVTQRVAA